MDSSPGETSWERGRKRRRQQYSSSSDYSSSSSSEDDNPAPPVAARATAVGRRLNLGREGGILQKNCQFVKRISADPALAGHRPAEGERPVYATGDAIAAADETLTDPREPRSTYATQMLANCSAAAAAPKPVVFLWDAQSKGRPPPCQVLLTGLQENVTSKSLLLNLIGAALGSRAGECIAEVQLTPGVAASLTAKDATASSALVKMFGRGATGTWNAVFDEDARQYHRLTTTASVTSKRPSGPLQEPKRCSRNIPCVLIPYAEIPSDESRRVLEDIFRKCRLYNVERGETCWHVHPLSEGEVGWIWRHRGEFHFRGRGLAMALELNGRSHTLSNGDTPVQRRRAEPVARPMEPPEKRPLLSLSRQESRVSLDALFVRPPSLDAVLGGEGFNTAAAATGAAENNDRDLTSLPVFNRRLIERKRAEQEALAKGDIATPSPNDTEGNSIDCAEPTRPASSKKSTLSSAAKAKHRHKHKEDRSETVSIAASDAAPELRLHESGCARTEGFYKQGPLEKVVFFEDIGSKLAQMRTEQGSQSGADRSAPSSRSNRAQNRRLQLTLEQVDSELFGKTTAFAARKKKLILGRSSIHSWGLFAGEDVEAGDLVCEYVGELIRHTVANVRERRYEMALRAKGSDEVASSYFFRLDDMLVVDATHKGNLSRFINHCCEPNCVAKILTGERRRIVMYARRDIRRGEEITYDYKFPLEDDPQKKIRCLCGARACRGYLN